MSTDYPIESLIPHRDNMSLIDKLLDWGDDWCQTQVNVSDSHLFIDNDYLPAYVCIEYMAQTIAALAGLRAQSNDESFNVGLLLGTRAYHCNVAKIHASTQLKVYAKELFKEENGLAVFSCSVIGPNIEITANLNVYQPENGELLNV